MNQEPTEATITIIPIAVQAAVPHPSCLWTTSTVTLRLKPSEAVSVVASEIADCAVSSTAINVATTLPKYQPAYKFFQIS
jgi:hypothetical protein